MNNKNSKFFKSLASSAIVILIYYYASKGIINLLWRSRIKSIDERRSIFILIILFISTLFMIVVPYYFLNDKNVEILYYGIMIFHALYLFFGSAFYLLIRE